MKTFTDERSLWLREAARQRDDAVRAHRQAAVCEEQGLPESAERYRHVARHHEQWAERYERWSETCAPAAV